MVIPVGAPNTAAALAFMNFAYRPEVQADIAAYVNYVTPVDGVKEILAKKDPELANDPLIFPPPSFTQGCSEDPNPPGSAAGPAGGHGAVPGRGHRTDGGCRRRLSEAPDEGSRMTIRRRLIPYWLLAPGALWLLLFFVIPMGFMARAGARIRLAPHGRLHLHLGVVELPRLALG